MKIKPTAIAALCTLVLCTLSLHAQGTDGGVFTQQNNGIPAISIAPGSIAGDSFLIQADDTNANLGMLMIDNTGAYYTIEPIVNNGYSSGGIAYSISSFNTALLSINDMTDSNTAQGTLTFSNSNTGSFVYTNLASSNTDTGSFTLATGAAPISLHGMTLSCTVSSGAFPFATNGTFNLYYSGTGGSYMIIGSGGVQNSSGNSFFNPENTSTLGVQTTDSVTGLANAYLAFTNSTSGIMAIAQTNSGGYQIDTFTVTNTLPPFYASNSFSLSNNWYWMSNGSNNLYGYYSTAYLPYIFHADMGWEYYMDAGDGYSGAYFYDFTDSAWYYSNPSAFPYLFDFNTDAWMWYEPSTNAPDHMSSNPRWFYNTSTTAWGNTLSPTNTPQ